MDEEKVDLSVPRANPDGLSSITPEELQAELDAAAVPPEVAAHRHVEPLPNTCGYDAYSCLASFVNIFASVEGGSKWLPHMAAIAVAIHNNRSDILDELSRAHARERDLSQVEIDTLAEARAAARDKLEE